MEMEIKMDTGVGWVRTVGVGWKGVSQGGVGRGHRVDWKEGKMLGVDECLHVLH